jgi:hypothetical protein
MSVTSGSGPGDPVELPGVADGVTAVPGTALGAGADAALARDPGPTGLPPDDAQPSPPQDLIDVLLAEHVTVNRLLAGADLISDDPVRRRELLDAAVAALSGYAAVEQQFLYPTVRQALVGGEHLADNGLAQHTRLATLMRELLGRDAADPDADQLAARLVREAREYLAQQEAGTFPRLRSACDPETLVHLGTAALAARKLAPTRPHPGAPGTPPLNRITDPGTGTARPGDGRRHRP